MKIPKSLNGYKNKVYSYCYRVNEEFYSYLNVLSEKNNCTRYSLLNRLLLFYANSILGVFPKNFTIIDYMNSLKEDRKHNCNFNGNKMANDNEVKFKK